MSELGHQKGLLGNSSVSMMCSAPFVIVCSMMSCQTSVAKLLASQTTVVQPQEVLSSCFYRVLDQLGLVSWTWSQPVPQSTLCNPLMRLRDSANFSRYLVNQILRGTLLAWSQQMHCKYIWFFLFCFHNMPSWNSEVRTLVFVQNFHPTNWIISLHTQQKVPCVWSIQETMLA